jgi:hypothetical protein
MEGLSTNINPINCKYSFIIMSISGLAWKRLLKTSAMWIIMVTAFNNSTWGMVAQIQGKSPK